MSGSVKISEMLGGGWYISYMNYYATGEGVRSCLAIAGSPDAAEDVLKKRINDYFHSAVETSALDPEMSAGARMMLNWLPDTVMDTLQKVPPGAGYYFTELFYNLA
jgi:hypothetical protein